MPEIQRYNAQDNENINGLARIFFDSIDVNRNRKNNESSI